MSILYFAVAASIVGTIDEAIQRLQERRRWKRRRARRYKFN